MHKLIFKNSFYLLFSQFLVKFFAFGYAIFLAGNVGATDFGTYSAALSIFGLLSLFADLGINRVLTRDIARDPNNLGKLFSTAILMRAFSTAFCFLVLVIVFYYTDPSGLRFSLTSIALLSLIPQSVALSIDAVLIAIKKVSISATGFFLYNMMNYIFGAILIFAGFGVIGAMIAFLIGHIIYALFLIGALILTEKIVFKPFDFKLAKEILILSLPYGILSAIGFASFRLDTVILSFTKGGAETGIYALAYRFLEAAVIVPSAFGTVLFPVFSELVGDGNKTSKLVKDCLLFGFGVGGTIVLIYLTVLPVFLTAFFPQSFFGAGTALQILSLAIPFMFMHIPLGQLLLSRESLLKQILGVYIFVFAVNLAMMLIFIPMYGYIAAAWITVITEATTFITFLIFVKKKILN